jgi:malonyl-CoA/methylmalonyl-CoA synthetase
VTHLLVHAPLLPCPADAGDREALRFGPRALTYGELAGAAGAVVASIEDAPRVAVWAAPELETGVAVVGALQAGVPVIPINPQAGERELAHILADGEPALLLAAAGTPLPAAVAGVPRLDVDVTARAARERPEPDPEAPAIIIYTSGTTGPAKGVVLPRRAIASNLDALAEAWEWTGADVLAHGLPLFHVHGLILGLLGPLRLGGTLHHLGSFSSAAAAAELAGPATMLFGVPTMYHRLIADAPEADPEIARALRRARLLVSGSAALPAADHERMRRLTGQPIVERYGMTETLMNTAVRADGDRRAGTVGPPVAGVELRLVADDGTPIAPEEDEVGEIHVRGPNLFLEYLNRPDATVEALSDGWFRTGDVATRDPDGYLRIVGRRATDLIKSGGFKIGAGEVESALLEHHAVADAAVAGEPDADLGERLVAWIVPAAGHRPPDRDELADLIARLLSPHKRPRVVRYLSALPRNEMGKVQKTRLAA